MLRKIVLAIVMMVGIVMLSLGLNLFFITLFTDSVLTNIRNPEPILDKALPSVIEKLPDLKDVACIELPEECERFSSMSENDVKALAAKALLSKGVKEIDLSIIERYNSMAKLSAFIATALGFLLIFLAEGFKLYRPLFRIGLTGALNALPYLLVFKYYVNGITPHEILGIVNKYRPLNAEQHWMEVTAAIGLELVRSASKDIVPLVTFIFIFSAALATAMLLLGRRYRAAPRL